MVRSNFKILASRARKRKKWGTPLGSRYAGSKVKIASRAGWERGESPVERCQAPIILGAKRSEMVGAKLVAGTLLALVAWSSVAQEHQHGNGEKLGTVHFATSCNEAAQKEFDRAVALLHSFQFSRAIEGFDTVLKEDATCAVAYWGIALSDWSNPFAAGMKDKGQLQAGRESAERGKTVGAKSERERAYLAAVGKLYIDFESTPQRARLIAYRDA